MKKKAKKNYHRLVKQLTKMTILQKKLNHFIKKIFYVRQKLEDLNALKRKLRSINMENMKTEETKKHLKNLFGKLRKD